MRAIVSKCSKTLSTVTLVIFYFLRYLLPNCLPRYFPHLIISYEATALIPMLYQPSGTALERHHHLTLIYHCDG